MNNHEDQMADRADGRKQDQSAVAARLDARGLRCPLPVLKARKRLGEIPDGATLEVIADDPAAWIDMPHFCAEAGHALLESRDAPAEGDGAALFVLQKGGGPKPQ